MPRLLVCLLFIVSWAHAHVNAVYLSWYDDPTTTMTVQWLTPVETDCDVLHVELPDGSWATAKGSHRILGDSSIWVHHLTLEHLLPDTTYRFRLGAEEKTYSFRTAPFSLDMPLRFVIGGDVYQSPKLFRKMSETVAQQDPLFAVLGGDLAYAIGPSLKFRSKEVDRWCDFLAEWQEFMVGENGRLIPLIAVSGNHDLTPDHYELFFELFAFPKKQLYRALDFGHYLSLILLDTGHFQPVQGRQTLWLSEALKERAHVPFLWAVYHEGAYPSFYAYQSETAKKVRTHWCPLFDAHSVNAVFENHSHALKQTYPLKGGQVDPSGTVYFGDGAWGVSPRSTHDGWYLKLRDRKNHVYLIEMSANSASINALGLTGDTLTKTTILSR